MKKWQPSPGHSASTTRTGTYSSPKVEIATNRLVKGSIGKVIEDSSRERRTDRCRLPERTPAAGLSRSSTINRRKRMVRLCPVLFRQATSGNDPGGWAVTEPSGCAPLEASRDLVPPA